MRIALVQQHCGFSREDNLRRALAAAERAADAGAELIAFAELGFERFHPQHACPQGPPRELAEPISGPTIAALVRFAERRRVVVLPNLYERDGDATYDTTVAIDADGTILGVTRMLHITHYDGFHETDYYAPGDRGAPVFATAVGRIGVAICYDRHYPEVMRSLALQGAELVVVPQAGTLGEWPEGLYEAEMRVAAFQNGYFTALVNRVGREDDLHFAGESFVCDPSGVVLARAGAGTDETLLCDLDLQAVQRSVARRLFLRDRRPEIVGALLGVRR
jgi:predicted amidohydrolase